MPLAGLVTATSATLYFGVRRRVVVTAVGATFLTRGGSVWRLLPRRSASPWWAARPRSGAVGGPFHSPSPRPAPWWDSARPAA